MKKLLLLSLFVFSITTSSWAQIQTPEQFLGYKPGDRFTPHHRMVVYFEHIAANNPNVQLIQYGETNEKRPLIVAILSSAENMADLEQIRTDNLRRTGMMDGEPSTSVPINWMSFNVHGNESVGMEAAISSFYTLANPENATSQEWLKNQVVIIDPCINPDGRDRYSNWYNQKMNTTLQPDLQSVEHNEPWPGGRANHYLFDLNRDWAWQVQVESQARMKLYNQWMPQLHLDFHEQGINNPFYMAPAAEPLHEQLTPWQHEFQDTFGRNTAKYFDEAGRFYFTKERFDLLYPSYGDSYPMFNGAIGMTIEQGGGGQAGIGGFNAVGDTVTLSYRIQGHYTAAMSAAEVTSKNAEKLLSEFQKFFDESFTTPKGQYKSFVIKGESNQAQVAKLLELLDKNGIKYGKAGTKSGLKGFSYGSGKSESFSIGEDDIIINAYQPKAVLTQLLFEPNPALHDSITYDITSWSMPYAYGLKAYALETRVNAAGDYEKPVFSENVTGKTPVAYIAAWEGTRDAAFLSTLLTADIRVKYNEFPFELEGKSFPAGSLLITKGGNEYVPNFDQKVVEIANKFQVTLATTMSGYVDKGKDFGSPNIRIIQAPKVALVGGEGSNSLNYGAIWHFFEKDLNYPLVNLELNNIARYDLSKYNVLIMPSMRGGGLSEQAQKNLMEWVRAGGKLIAIDGALNLFADKEGFGLKTFDSDDDKKAAEKVADSLAKAERLAPYQEGERVAISGGAAGAIYQVTMDETHPLGYGTGGKYYTLKNNSSKFAYLSNGVNAGIIANNDAYRTGYIGFKIKSTMGESMAIGVEDAGRGEIVYFVDDPIFRGFWEAGKLILSNAIFMVGQ
ncbi:M14 family metallopeptidase [Algoriphagus sp. D3-2-R+10]|uniref:M14 family metallopeptidase n=1 Tax=Algoriphagus aurantiacus TaxID=3103948 RepID=UPI002B3BBE0E|nr:M14 family metallopeptidase [Algoriphagus sp. D3-2-R+10]MEB2773877.1 M14 family metallopeptidase [Algoriphagus sp. D3-2-R+10]